MIERPGGWTIGDETIRDALRRGATHYEVGTFDSYFIVWRPHLRRRYWLWGERVHTGWDRLIYYSTPGYGASGVVWVAPDGWEGIHPDRVVAPGSLHELAPMLEAGS